MHRIITIAALLLAGFSSSFAQQVKWKKLAGGILSIARNSPSSPAEYGAIDVKDTIILAGWANLQLSTNAGATWTVLRLPAISSDNHVNDVAIYDDHTFAVICQATGVHYTSDRGTTWITSPSGQATKSVLFGNSSTTLVLGGLAMLERFSVSTGDLIQQWTSRVITNLKQGADMALYALGATSTDNLLYRSTDDGLTWSIFVPTIPSQADCWGMICDRDDAQRFLVINEDWAYRIDNTADVFLSSDGGASWRNTLSESLGSFAYLSGNATQGCHDYFIGTLSNGVLRSKDKGLTWATIGGPPTPIDSRFVCAFDDSIIYAVDTFGSVWVTDALRATDAGPLSTDSAFQKRPIGFCDSLLVGKVVFYSSNGCVIPTAIDSIAIIGQDASDYSFEQSFPLPAVISDTIPIYFRPSKAGTTDAKLKVTYSNGVIRYIDLNTTVKPPTTLSFTNSSTITISTDTLGGDITIPILLTKSLDAHCEFLIHYDTTYAKYKGTFDSLGVDHTIEDIDGRVRIRYDPSVDTSLLASFSLFPIDSNCSKVRIDSISSLDSSKCIVVGNTIITATICGPQGCGISTLSKFIRYGTTPEFAITPNPARGMITLRSNMDIDGASIEIRNEVGAISYSNRSDIKKAEGLSLDVSSLPSGAYILLVKGYGAGIPLVIMK